MRLLVITVSCAKTAEPIEMPFGVWTWVGQRNHVLDGTQIPPGKREIFREDGGISRPTVIIGNIRGVRSIVESLFGRRRQRCGLSLSVLQQLVRMLREVNHLGVLVGLTEGSGLASRLTLTTGGVGGPFICSARSLSSTCRC